MPGLVGMLNPLVGGIIGEAVAPLSLDLVNQGTWDTFVDGFGNEPWVLMDLRRGLDSPRILGYEKSAENAAWRLQMVPDRSLLVEGGLQIFKIKKHPSASGSAQPDQPVVGVSLLEAVAFCLRHYPKGRLPTRDESLSLRRLWNPHPEIGEWVLRFNSNSNSQEEAEPQREKVGFRIMLPKEKEMEPIASPPANFPPQNLLI